LLKGSKLVDKLSEPLLTFTLLDEEIKDKLRVDKIEELGLRQVYLLVATGSWEKATSQVTSLLFDILMLWVSAELLLSSGLAVFKQSSFKRKPKNSLGTSPR
jgi:hypothetical protein